MDIEVYSRFLITLVGVLALIAVLAWLARRFGLGGKLVPAKGKGRRLSVIEVMALDSRRKLVLLGRDGVEHLVLLGVNRDMVIEPGIVPPLDAAEDAGADAPVAAALGAGE